jgi:hypothetical protein
VTRIYTGEDGQTHAEEYDVPLTSQRGATELSDPVAVTSVQFRRTSPEYFIDWHTAPRRQYVITLAGESEVELGDGDEGPTAPGPHPARRGHHRPGAHLARHRRRGPDLHLPAARRAVDAWYLQDLNGSSGIVSSHGGRPVDAKNRAGAAAGGVVDVQPQAGAPTAPARPRRPDPAPKKTIEECLQAMSQAPLRMTLSWPELRKITREP